MPEEQRVFIGLAIGMISLIVMLTKSKLHVFLSLIFSAFITGIISGMPLDNVIQSVKAGFGQTLSELGLLIVFGIMLGKLLEISGSTQSIANYLLRLFGDGREHYALMITGFIVSLAIFAPPAYLMLFPVAKSIAQEKQLPLSKLAIPMAAGMFLANTFVPPASAPIGAAEIFEAHIVEVMFWGTILSIIIMVFYLFYAEYLGKRYQDIPEKMNKERVNEENLPSIFTAIAPILIALLLIVGNAIVQLMSMPDGLHSLLDFLGDPIVALGIGIIIAFLTSVRPIEQTVVRQSLNEAVQGGVNVLLMVGAGGALGKVVNDGGAGYYIAEGLSQTAIPAMLLPFIISTALRLIQGSGSVATITAASISEPILQSLGVDPLLGTMAATAGATIFSFYNDSYFWVVNESLNRRHVKDQIVTWSIPTTVSWVIAFIFLLLLGLIY